MRKTGGGVLILVAILTACGSPQASTGTAQNSEPSNAEPTPQRDDDCSILGGIGPRLAAVDNSFGPDCITVRSDATLYVQNFGKYKHTFTISESEFGTKPFVVDVNLPGGSTKPRPVELASLGTGSYEFFCALHGGMDGVIEIIDPVGA